MRPLKQEMYKEENKIKIGHLQFSNENKIKVGKKKKKVGEVQNNTFLPRPEL